VAASGHIFPRLGADSLAPSLPVGVGSFLLFGHAGHTRHVDCFSSERGQLLLVGHKSLALIADSTAFNYDFSHFISFSRMTNPSGMLYHSARL
jgi:hypothetical protein